MTPALTGSPQQAAAPSSSRVNWSPILWVSALLVFCYFPVLSRLVAQWNDDGDMGHGFFVPIIAGYIAWQKRGELASRPAQPNWWGLAIVIWGAIQLWVATLGAELFLARTAFVFSVIGCVLLLGGTRYLKVLAFPLFLLFFMVPIPAVIYNRITLPLQFIASSAAEHAIDFLQIPIIRTGNILELANQKLNVVEACSGIRSLLTLSFISLVYGYFFEKRTWVRVALFFATIPIAIVANASRVTLTGVLANWRPELAEGAVHEAQGWVIFVVAFLILIALHQSVALTERFFSRVRNSHA
jgi:exosortase